MFEFIIVNIGLFLCSYLCLSVIEWFVHGFIQHGRRKKGFISGISRRHLTHHKITNIDMSLIVPTDTFIKDKFNDYHGLFALWGLTFSNIFAFIFISLCFVKLFALTSLAFYSLIFHGILIALFQSIVWNSIHPSLHFVGKELTIIEGPDFINRNWFQTTKLHEVLWTNHVIHHLVPGKKQGNFNGSLIGADYLFGTSRTRSDCPEFIIDSKKLTIQKRLKIIDNSHNI